MKSGPSCMQSIKKEGLKLLLLFFLFTETENETVVILGAVLFNLMCFYVLGLCYC